MTKDFDKPWSSTHRRETGLVEHNCIHGIGHPAYASADFMDKTMNHEAGTWSVHGCDGCCGDIEWQVQDLKDGIDIANELILGYLKQLYPEPVQ